MKVEFVRKHYQSMNLKKIQDADFRIKPTSTGGYAVVYPGEGTRYFINRRGTKMECTCPGYKYRGQCKILLSYIAANYPDSIQFIKEY